MTEGNNTNSLQHIVTIKALPIGEAAKSRPSRDKYPLLTNYFWEISNDPYHQVAQAIGYLMVGLTVTDKKYSGIGMEINSLMHIPVDRNVRLSTNLFLVSQGYDQFSKKQALVQTLVDETNLSLASIASAYRLPVLSE